MGAQPKNKITRVERGKRRAGNTPSLTKDPRRTKAPLHKKSLLSKFEQFLGQAPTSQTSNSNKKTHATSETAKAGTQATQAPTKTKVANKTALKTNKRTPVSRGK